MFQLNLSRFCHGQTDDDANHQFPYYVLKLRSNRGRVSPWFGAAVERGVDDVKAAAAGSSYWLYECTLYIMFRTDPGTCKLGVFWECTYAEIAQN